jgi:hypothetical protein
MEPMTKRVCELVPGDCFKFLPTMPTYKVIYVNVDVVFFCTISDNKLNKGHTGTVGSRSRQIIHLLNDEN